MKSVALFGGTFNPIHYGHLAIAEEVRTKHNLDKVIFVPANLPPHKEPEDLVDAQRRSVMAYLATVSNPCFEVSTFEVDRGGKSYTVDTVRHFHHLFGGKVELFFIIGADMLPEIFSWKNIGGILELCRFIAVSRPGYDVQKILNQHFLSAQDHSTASKMLERILVEETAMLDISATAIRRRIKEWKSIKYLVPEPVEQFIHNQQLYL
ncbi:MAG TPA: nicotinate-nucleotide adenylyltransferase [bacterium]|nr:nicotinate-nucleotide adenylyltransferase [bacterium]